MRIQETFKVDIPLRTIFESPTIEELAVRIEEMRLTNKGTEEIHITPVSRDEALVLSFAQQRLWFLDQLEKGSSLYNIPAAFVLKGQLNQEALERCFTEMVRRHEVLRTTFGYENDEPVQVIHPSQPFHLELVDLMNHVDAEQEQLVQKWIKDEASQPFDLEQGPLFRAKLLCLNDEKHVLVLNLHHIISDGWSTDVFIRELRSLYAAYCEGKTSPLPELPIQYADFANWQRSWLKGDVLDKQLTYWKKQFEGDIPVLEMPTDHQRPAVQTYRGAYYPISVNQEITQKLREVSQEQGTTMFMSLLGAFQVILHRYSGQEDIVVGTPIANRRHKEVENLIGFFVNTLALRTDLSGNPTFKELLNRVRDVTLGAYSHQDLPFERLVEELQVERDLSRSPLFQVMFVLQNASNESVELKGLSIESYPVVTGLSKYDLSLSFKETETGLQGGISYNTDLFEERTIIRLSKHLEVLLEEVTHVPDQRIGEVSILTKEEETQLLSGWKQNKATYPQDTCIHELFEEQVKRTPDEIAVVDREKVLTYAELNQKANKLAHRLRKEGIQSEVLTGVCVQRSSTTLVAILGVLKAGGTYVPIDPNYPPERISYMVEDSQATLLLTEECLVEQLTDMNSKLLCIDTEWELIEQESDQNLPKHTASSNLSYVIYTSGSTGKPKGVAIEHRNAVAMISWAKEFYSMEELDTVLFGTSICFDLSVYEMFVPLSVGGKVVVAENALAISTLPWRDRVTLINSVPSVVSELLEMGAIPTSVQTVNLAGEPLSNELAQKIYSLGTVKRVYNLYGPSEDTTYSTVELVKKGATSAPLIGQPIANTTAYVLDRNRNLVPIGVPGELYLQGAGVVRGYLHKKELTEESFIPCPFTSTQENMYKTGDLVRYTEDGKLEYIGRIDDQVKIRGFRIELGEIEQSLNSHPKVKEAVVVAQGSDTDKRDTQLVAYVVPEQTEEPTRSELYSYLRKTLPDYMVPSSFVVIEEIPLTPNGKINRIALVEIGLEMEMENINKNVSPRDDIEKILAEIWSDCLNRPEIRIYDNFFEIGGHSLLAVRVLSRLEANLSLILSLADIFKYPTIESLATHIREKTTQINWRPLVEMKNSYSGNQTPIFLIHGGGTSVLPYRKLIGNLKLDNPIYGINPYGLEQTHSPQGTIEDMARTYIKIIQNVQSGGLYNLIGWSLGGLVSLEIAKQLKEVGEKVGLLILIDSELTNNQDFKETNYVDEIKNLDLPPHLIELTKVHLSAQQKYQIPMYNGPTLYIQANEASVERKDRNKKLLKKKFKEIEIVSVPGNHYSMLEEPQVNLVSKKIEDVIEAKIFQRNI